MAAKAKPKVHVPAVIDGMPSALALALRSHSVVVVSLYTPDASVDSMATDEARHGALAAHVGFVAFNVADEKIVAPLSSVLTGGADACRPRPRRAGSARLRQAEGPLRPPERLRRPRHRRAGCGERRDLRPVSAAEGTSAGRELFVRHARRDGRSIAVMRAVDHGELVRRRGRGVPERQRGAPRPGPYTFADAREATAFVTEAVEALMYLGCDIQAA